MLARLLRRFVSWILGEREIAAEQIKPGDAVYKGEDGRWYKSKMQYDGFERNEQ